MILRIDIVERRTVDNLFYFLSSRLCFFCLSALYIQSTDLDIEINPQLKLFYDIDIVLSMHHHQPYFTHTHPRHYLFSPIEIEFSIPMSSSFPILSLFFFRFFSWAMVVRWLLIKRSSSLPLPLLQITVRKFFQVALSA